MMQKEFLIISVVFIISLSTIVSADHLSVNAEQTERAEYYDYVIVTNKYLENSVEKLKEWREKQGFSVKIVTGYNGPEKLRNFLKDNYVEWGIKYVLIIGSHRTIPMKYCWPNPDNHILFGHYKQPIPTDHYYADLSSNWDNDSDGYYGEYKDDIDNLSELLPEVYVGRVPFDNPYDVKKFCQKIIKYEQDNGDWKKKALLLAPFLTFNNPYGDCAPSAEILKNSILLPNGYNCTTMYEKAGLNQSKYSCDYPLNSRNVIKIWREGYGIVNFISHGFNMRVIRVICASNDGDGAGVPKSYLNSFHTFLLNDNKPSVVYARSCSTACPELRINLGASLLKHGAIIYIGAARPTGGGVLNCVTANEEFLKIITNEDIRYGDAWHTAKFKGIENVSDGGENYIWHSLWFAYNFVFYGDPATTINIEN